MKENLKKFLLISGVILGLLLPNSSPVYANHECTTPAQVARQAADVGFTHSIEIKGLALSRFFDAYAKVSGVDRASIVLEADAVLEVYTTAIDPSIAVAVLYEGGCVAGSASFTADQFNEIYNIYRRMQAEAEGNNG